MANYQTRAFAKALPQKGLMMRLKVPTIIAGIVFLEWVIAVLLLPNIGATSSMSLVSAASIGEPGTHIEVTTPSGRESASLPGRSVLGTSGRPNSTDLSEPQHDDAIEVDLGNFAISGFQPASNCTLFIAFHLYGVAEPQHSGELRQRLAESQHRIRDSIIVIARSAEITDLTDAGLGLIKRRILEKINKALGKPLLQEVVFSEFSFIEQ